MCLRLRRRPSTPAKTLVNLEQCFKKISSWGRRDPAAASATLTPADPRSAPARRTTTRYEFEFRHTSNCHNECFYFFIVFLPQLFPGHPSLHRADAGGAGGGQDAPHQPVHVKLGRGDVFGAHGWVNETQTVPTNLCFMFALEAWKRRPCFVSRLALPHYSCAVIQTSGRRQKSTENKGFSSFLLSVGDVSLANPKLFFQERTLRACAPSTPPFSPKKPLTQARKKTNDSGPVGFFTPRLWCEGGGAFLVDVFTVPLIFHSGRALLSGSLVPKKRNRKYRFDKFSSSPYVYSNFVPFCLRSHKKLALVAYS